MPCYEFLLCYAPVTGPVIIVSIFTCKWRIHPTKLTKGTALETGLTPGGKPPRYRTPRSYIRDPSGGDTVRVKAV